MSRRVFPNDAGLVPLADEGNDLPADAIARRMAAHAMPASLASHPGVISTSSRPGPT
jgi:hypothetical protein